MEKRKKDHIDLALNSQSSVKEHDDRFNYEPMLNPHPKQDGLSIRFLGKNMKNPLWISSMTGGTDYAKIINTNLAKACNEFGLGMGLGSCRPLLESDQYFKQYDLRDIIGNDYPFYANLGISQVEQAVHQNKLKSIIDLVDKLRADGLVIHVNPIQEWLQPEGDILTHSPIDTIKSFLDNTQMKVIVKEVGQGFGPESLKALLKLPLEAIEFGAYGGTNFSKVELKRSMPIVKEMLEPFSKIGNNAEQMVDDINIIINETTDILCKQIIISGGIGSFLDGYYLMRKSKLPSIYGQASTMLRYAREDYEKLREYIQYQIKGLQMAFTYLTIKK
ncbi:MAG: isopentenyl-diphosphate delta-isomerase [Bacteroidetes bacterium GWA2_31_9b]|nr:MAG: isopentenyl-diphosphate delta-isomerase [Bacteroidetes bacterium GWA2_31_9b]